MKAYVFNMFFYTISALMLYRLGDKMSLDLLPQVFAEYVQHCVSYSCAVTPEVVSSVSLLHGLYSILFILVMSARFLLLPQDRKSSLNLLKMVAFALPVITLIMVDQRFGFERSGLASNYVYKRPIYLVVPSIIMGVLCLMTHLFYVSKLFDVRMAQQRR